MIYVQLNEANFEYDIHSLVKAYFPQEDVLVSAENKQPKEGVSFRLAIDYLAEDDQGDIIIEETESKITDRAVKGRIFFQVLEPDFEEADWKTELPEAFEDEEADINLGSFRLVTAGDVAVDYGDRKETKNRLKQALYHLLADYTGETLPWGTLTGIRPTKIPMAMLEEGKTETEIEAYMKETYFASQEKIDLSMEVAKAELELLKKIDYENGYSLYIGIPFCPSTCLYCSFTSYPIGVWSKRVDDYLDALEKEIAYTAKVCKNKHLNTIYIGGGTPTSLNHEQLDRLLTKVEESFDFSHLVEYTVEAGRPDSITREKLQVLRDHNISRISINPQTMKDETLKLIGRNHTVAQTVESFKLARELGFDNINMDLIVGLPEETIEDVERTMLALKELDPDNITVHSLAVKRAARLKMQQEEYKDLKMENTWDTIDLTANYARGMGMTPYYLYRQKNMAGNFENVGYAKPGCAGIYNILIMEEKQTIMALGAGATTKFVLEGGERIERVGNVKDVTNYLERIDEMIDRKAKEMEELGWL